MIVCDHNPDHLAPDAFAAFELPEPGICHATSATVVFTGTDTIIRDVIATADADTTLVIAHGLGAAPAEVTMTPLLSQALTALAAWTVAIDATNLTLTKLASVGSGNAAAQLRVIAKRPHTIGR